MKLYVWDDGRVFFCSLAESVENARAQARRYYPGMADRFDADEPDVYDQPVCFLIEQA